MHIMEMNNKNEKNNELHEVHKFRYKSHFSEQQLLNFLLDSLNLRFYLRSLILSHTCSYDWSANSTSSSQSLLGSHEHVGDILILAEKRNVEKNLQRLAVSCQDDELRLASVQGLGGLVGSLPQLLVIGRLLNKIQDLSSKGLISKRISFGVDFFRHLVGCLVFWKVADKF